MFKALADPIRLRLLSIITSAGGEICVCDITPQFDVSGPTISHHLKVLREAGLVDCERRGTWVYYWPIPERTPVDLHPPRRTGAGPLSPAATSPQATVLFVCIHNAGRSQMAAGWLRHGSGHTITVPSRCA